MTFGYFTGNANYEIIHQHRQRKVNEELLNTKSPVRRSKYPQGYSNYVEEGVKIYKLLLKNNII